MPHDVSDEHKSVSEYIRHELLARQNADENETLLAHRKKQVTMRIPNHAYDRLVELAGDLGHSPSGLAGDLLELAIYESAQVVEKPETY